MFRPTSSRTFPSVSKPASDTPLAEELTRLEAVAADARERRTAAKDRRRHEAGVVPKEATAALLKCRDDIELRKPEAVPPEERKAKLRELTAGLLALVEERGLAFQ